MNASAFSKHLDLAILRSREALAVVDQIEAAPAKVAELQIELGRAVVEVRHLQSVFATEKAAWAEERLRWKAEGDRDWGDRQRAEAELLAKLDEAKAELLALQNKISSVRQRLEKLATLFRKLDRMRAHPSSGAPAMPAVIAELLELAQ
jgi:chromosome segregation ATPase